MTIKIIANSSNTIADVETNSLGYRTVIRPESYGSYSRRLASGQIGAGLAANSNVFYFSNFSSNTVCLLKKFILCANNVSTAFTAGVATFKLLIGRKVSAAGGTGLASSIAGDNAKLSSKQGGPNHNAARGVTSQSSGVFGMMMIANTGAIAAPTGVYDTDPATTLTTAIDATLGSILVKPSYLINTQTGGYPLILTEYEAIALQATVPATGLWNLTVALEWDEITSYV